MADPETIEDADHIAKLRRQAEERVRKIELDSNREAIPVEQVQSIIHELRVHQIELEMQNEELRRAQEELEDSRSQYRYLYNFAPIGYFSCDSKGVIQRINLTGAKLFGLERSKLTGRPISPYLQKGQSQVFFAYLKKVFESDGKKQTSELKLKRADGSEFTARFESMANESDNGLYCLAAFMDITELKEAEERLKNSNAELEQFASAASHDMREPLRTIAGFLQLLEKKYKGQLDDKADEYIAFTVDSAKRLDKLLTDLVEYSTVSTHPLKKKVVDCSVAMGKAIADLGAAITESGAEITQDSLPTVFGDESQIRRVFQNLLSNSIKFHGDKKPRIHISARQEDKQWLFSVHDNGIGVDPEFAKQVFVVFRRLHTRQEYEGTGMGLALCKKIVKLHGGRIWLESEPGKGSTFYFTLPV